MPNDMDPELHQPLVNEIEQVIRLASHIAEMRGVKLVGFNLGKKVHRDFWKDLRDKCPGVVHDQRTATIMQGKAPEYMGVPIYEVAYPVDLVQAVYTLPGE